jgi:exonuclease III
MQWNAGGLPTTKLTEIKHIIKEKDIDVLIVNEANIVAEKMKYYNIQGFNNYLLPKSRHVASGIFAAVKNTVTTKFNIIKEMNDQDTSEIVKLTLWKKKINYIWHL